MGTEHFELAKHDLRKKNVKYFTKDLRLES